MPIPKRTQDRYDAERKFPLGCRMVRKSTGHVYIRGAYKSMREVWVMSINPGRKGTVSWTVLVQEFELASI